MENKYYTPEIEEFCVGFEFERQMLSPHWEPLNWEKETFTIDTNLKIISEYKHLHRVKHLDIEDIEEVLLPLNFILQENKYNISNHIDYLKGSIYEKAIGISLENSLVKIWIFDFKGENDSKSEQGPFILKIRNKSELMKLMQMLNIE